MQSKVCADANSALHGALFDGMSIMAGGFGLCGIPENLITALCQSAVKNLTVIGNNVGADDHGMWAVLANGQIKKVLASEVGENQILEQLFTNDRGKHFANYLAPYLASYRRKKTNDAMNPITFSITRIRMSE